MSDITLGIIGSGQLGSLLCQAAKKLNVKTVVISDDEQGPAQNYSNEFIYSKYDDENKIKEFIDKVDIATFEFENIPVNILKKIELKKKVFPKPEINKIIQNRFFEKKQLPPLPQARRHSFIRPKNVVKSAPRSPTFHRTGQFRARHPGVARGSPQGNGDGPEGVPLATPSGGGPESCAGHHSFRI